MIDNVVDQLMRDEGCKLGAYKDSLGFWTIGFGHKLNVPSDEGCNVLWTMDQAHANLIEDIRVKFMALRAALPWVDDLDVVRRGALTNMAFNMGIGVKGGKHGLLSFSGFLGLMEAHKFEEAAADEMHTLWAKQVGARATRLSEQIRRGQWI